MDLVAGYSSDSSVDSVTMARLKKPTSMALTVNLAPSVDDVLERAKKALVNPSMRELDYNPRYDELYGAVEGPANPNQMGALSAAQMNCWTGYVETHHVSEHTFNENYQRFQCHGVTANPSDDVGSNAEVSTKYEVPLLKEVKGSAAKKRLKLTHPDNDMGPCMELDDRGDFIPAPMDEEREKYMEEQAGLEKKRGRGPLEEIEEKSMFHAPEERLFDYQGRSFIVPPSDKRERKPNTPSFIPKTWEHTWTAHSKGVAAIRFFPKSGHLLLSCGMDSKIKIFDVNTKKTMRTYLGHSKAVRDVQFTNDGRQFLSTAYDRYAKIWDTETGTCLGSFNSTPKKVFFCVRFHPDESKQHIFMAGASDKKIYQWDARTNQVEQVYDQHLGAVNTITFIDDNRRFVSTSDDKKIFVWDWGIPVPIKYISDPSMHSVPFFMKTPNEKWMLGQSLDNQIIVYGVKGDRFRLNRKKRFVGHINAGYACQVDVSPDEQFVCSGDSDGTVWFWDWKTTRVYRKLKAHDGVAIGCAWHPVETSKFATCGWDGLIKYWD